MPDVAQAPDEQANIRDFLEQQRLLEEERRQQEEAARVLAEQDALAAQQGFVPGGIPQGEPAPMPQEVQMPAAPAPSYSVDSQQYANEVARAQRGSGFINADIGPGGNVITAGYDPEKDPRAIVARREAENLQRNQYVASLVKGGATMAEALRSANGRYPGTIDPALSIKAEQLALKQNFRPQIVTQDGVQMMSTAPGAWRALTPPKPTRIQGGKVDPLVTQQAGDLSKAITIERQRLSRGTKPGIDSGGKQTHVPLTDTDQEAIRAEIKRLETNQANLYGPGGHLAPEFNAKVDQPSYMRMKDAFNAPPPVTTPQAQAAPTVSETITITTKEQFDKLPSGSVYAGKDGKKYRKP